MALPLGAVPTRGGRDYDGGVGIVNGEPVLMWDCTNDPVCNTTATRLVGGDAHRWHRAAGGQQRRPEVIRG